MQGFAQLLQWWNLIYLIPLFAALVALFVSLIGLLPIGETAAGVDHDVETDHDLRIEHDMDMEHDVELAHDVDMSHDVDMAHDVEMEAEHDVEATHEAGLEHEVVAHDVRICDEV